MAKYKKLTIDEVEFTDDEKDRLKEFFGEKDKDFDTTDLNFNCYEYNTYISNIDKEPIEQHIENLLEWKDPRRLSSNNKKGTSNVDNVKKIDAIKEFRKKSKVKKELSVFKGGTGVYDVLIKHIALPTEYPLFDIHVLGAYFRLEKGFDDGEFTHRKLYDELYKEYRNFFLNLYERVFKEKPKDDKKTIKRMKRLDNALLNYDKEKAKQKNPNQTKED